MKSFALPRIYGFIAALLLAPLYSIAQLPAGAIAFTGFDSRGATPAQDWFSFVLCQSIPAGTTINFTDRGYQGNNTFQPAGSLEGSIAWNYPASAVSSLPAGTEIAVSSNKAYLNGSTTDTVGTITVLEGTNSAGTGISITGTDQIIAYQGTLGSASNMIAGMHWNVCIGSGNVIYTANSTWDPSGSNCLNSNSASQIPPGLTGGTNAIWMGTVGIQAVSSAVYSCANNPTPHSPANFRTSVNNTNNWTNKTIGAVSTATPPTGSACGRTYYAVILPVNIVTFDANRIVAGNRVDLKWVVKEEQNINRYEVERSNDAAQFVSIGAVNAGRNSEDYLFTDTHPLSSNTWYRLVARGLDGSRYYSAIIQVNGITVDGREGGLSISPVPATNALDVVALDKNAEGKIKIIDAVGRLICESDVSTTGTHIEVSNWPNGLYLLQAGNGDTYKILKN